MNIRTLGIPLAITALLALAIAVIVAAGGYALSTKPIEPKLSHINPLAGIGRAMQ